MADFVVTTLADETFQASDGTTTDGAGLSLREAIGLALANGAHPSDTITFNAGLAGGVLTLTNGELTISSNLTISGDVNGDRKADITIDGNNASRGFKISTAMAMSVTLDSLVITGGNADTGGGLDASVGFGGDLTITNSTISGNSTTGNGGGISAYGTVRVINTTISGNTAGGYGGGVYLDDADATLTNVTMSGNGAHRGGAIAMIFGGGSTLALNSSTLSGNQAYHTGGLYNGGEAILTNSIVAGNNSTAPNYIDEIYSQLGFLSFSGMNVVAGSDHTGPNVINPSSLGDVFASVGANPFTGVSSGVLADNQGAVQTIAISLTSVARDAGITTALPADTTDVDRDGNTTEVLPVDGRGLTRVLGSSVDIGALEAGNYQVTTLGDSGADATVTGSFAAEAADGGGLSLREAILLADADPDANSITFSALLAGQALTLSNGELAIANDVAISGDVNGDHKADITVSGNNASRVFNVSSGTVRLESLVITGGSSTQGSGINVTGGTVTLVHSAVSENVATSSAGIANYGGTLSVVNSTVSGNSASGYSGGIGTGGGSSTTLINSTVVGNFAGVGGGGIGQAIGTSLALISSTVSGNTSINGGGIINNGSAALTNSIVAGNEGGEIAGTSTPTFTGVNVVGTGGDTDASDGVIQASSLGALFANVGANPDTSVVSGLPADNGGPVQTILIQTGGTAHNTGTTAALPADTADLDGDGDTAETLPLDARGLARVSGVSVDIGAVELRPNTAPAFEGTLSDGSQAVLLAENSANGAAVFNVNANDGDGGATDAGLTYTITAGNGNADGDANAAFAIDASTGAITVNDADDLGAGSSIALTVQADDGGTSPSTSTATVTVNITGAPETFTVTTLADQTYDGGSLAAERADGGGLSLREAIGLALANGADSSDTITFKAGLANGTLTLTNGQLAISSNVTIDGDINGDGDADITIDAQGNSRVLLIDSPFPAPAISTTLNGLVLQNGTANRGGGISLGGDDTLTISNSVVSGNQASDRGGGIYHSSASVLTVIGTTVSGNSASGDGGGIAAGTHGYATLIGSTVSGNRSGDDGGGICLDDHAAVTLVNTTLSGNAAAQKGGGIYGFFSNTITLLNSTVTGNSAKTAGGIYNDGGDNAAVTLTNSIVAGNKAQVRADDLYGSFGGFFSDLEFSGANIIGSAPDNFEEVTGLATNATQINGADEAALRTVFADVALVDPDGPGGTAAFFAGVLADNGGAVQTVAIKLGGIAQDAGNDAELADDTADLNGNGNTTEPVPFDARGSAFFRVALGQSDIGAFEAGLIVTTLADQAYDGGDLASETADGSGLSLREALALANGDAGADIITFAAGLSGGALLLTNMDGELVVSSDVIIDGDVNGDGAPDITVSGNNASRVFHVNGGAAPAITASLNGLVIRDGNFAGIRVAGGDVLNVTDSTITANVGSSGGGGIVNYGATTLTNTTVSDNDGGSGSGGGIVNSGGTLDLINSTVSGNDAGHNGAGIYNVNLGTVTVTNSTISDNTAGHLGGGIHNAAGTLTTLVNTTVSGNFAGDGGGGILNQDTLRLSNSIVAGNGAAGSGDDNIEGAQTLFGANFIHDTLHNSGGSFGGYSLASVFRELVTIDPDGVASNGDEFFAGALADNGGLVQTIALNPDIDGSPVLDLAEPDGPIDEATLGADLNGNGNATDSIDTDARGLDRTVDAGLSSHERDLGAFEQQAAQTYTVTTLDDELDASDADPATYDPDDLSLREALALTNADRTTHDTINFDPLFVNERIELALGELVISGGVTIDGDGEITVDAGGNSRVFRVEGAGSVAASLNGLTIFQGQASDGAGVWVGEDDAVTLTRSTVNGNTATGDGGGIYVRLGSVTLIDSFVSGNSAGRFGGAINSNAGEITVINTTLAQNEANYGGALFHGGAGGATFVDSALWDNSAAYDGGGILANSGTIVLTNTTLWGNSADRDGGGISNHSVDATLTNVTLTGNYAGDEGGGIFNGATGTLTLANSIVAGNETSTGVGNVEGTITLLGGNIVGETFTLDGGSPQGGFDLTDIFASVGNNMFTGVLSGEAGGNGGDVLTVALDPDAANPAINSGDASSLSEATTGRDLDGDGDQTDTITTDARGFDRDVGGVDLGAFEFQNAAPTVGVNAGLTLAEGAIGTIAPAVLDFNDTVQPDASISFIITAAAAFGKLLLDTTELGVGGTFTQEDINNSRVRYVHNGSETVNDSFGFSVSDGVGGIVTAQSFAFIITPVNDAPVNAVPGTLGIEANTNTAIAGLSITDVDAGAGNMTATLAVLHGTLTVASTGGAAVTGSGTGTVALTGTLAQINTTLSAANNVVYKGAQDFFGTDTLTVVTDDGGNSGAGGALGDTDAVTIGLNTHLFGTPGNDAFNVLPGNARIDALGGIDTITFGFRLVDATVSYAGNTAVIDGPAGSHTVLTGFEVFNFTDGTVNDADGSPLIDDLFYYSQNHDVWNAHVDADFHYNVTGWREGRDPNAFFDLSIYLSANPDVKAAGVNPLTHYDAIGWKEGRIPSLAFDGRAYLDANPDVKAASIDPLWHFLATGASEGRQPVAPTTLVGVNGFDFVYYLANNPDVAAAGVDPFWHFQTTGWKEGRDPNALFDVSGYLAAYTDVAAAHVNPLDHYNTHGWHEGRDPSLGFDTASYLTANADVAAANINPLTHFLHIGQHEGRSAVADGVWG